MDFARRLALVGAPVVSVIEELIHCVECCVPSECRVLGVGQVYIRSKTGKTVHPQCLRVICDSNHCL